MHLPDPRHRVIGTSMVSSHASFTACPAFVNPGPGSRWRECRPFQLSPAMRSRHAAPTVACCP
eukprot:6705063-Prymnesium_polylepis.1